MRWTRPATVAPLMERQGSTDGIAGSGGAIDPAIGTPLNAR